MFTTRQITGGDHFWFVCVCVSVWRANATRELKVADIFTSKAAEGAAQIKAH